MRVASRTGGGSRKRSPPTSRPICAGSPLPGSIGWRLSSRPRPGARRSRRRAPAMPRKCVALPKAAVRASRPSPSSMRATSWRSPCSGRRRRGKEPARTSCSKSGPTAAPPSASRPRRPTIATPGSARTGIGSKACMGAPSSCRRGGRANRVSSASPRPASPAERWASTNAGSGWSRTGSPRATMAAIPTASRSMCGAAKCWTRKHSNRRRGR